MDAAADTARLRWRCRRGMRELDMLVSRWLDERYAAAGASQRAAFARLLDSPDPELLGWLTGRSRPEDPGIADIVDEIRAFT